MEDDCSDNNHVQHRGSGGGGKTEGRDGSIKEFRFGREDMWSANSKEAKWLRGSDVICWWGVDGCI